MKGKVGGQWNKFFMEFSGQCYMVFCLVSLTELCSFWFALKDPFTLHKLADKVVLDH